jgi:hypothetical protein
MFTVVVCVEPGAVRYRLNPMAAMINRTIEVPAKTALETPRLVFTIRFTVLFCI